MKLNGRTVIDAEIDGVDARDFPDFCDTYFSYAVFEDNGAALTDEELDQLTDANKDTLNNLAFAHCL